ncbi:MAG: PadR family transcriptional regulator [Ktedonobacteraceae bacterium]
MAIEHSILGMISLRPCSGYDLKAEFEKGGAALLSASSFGSIYPHLKRLEQDGLIEAQEESGNGRHKKVYELTAKGWQELAHWLEQSSEYPMPMRDELLLKMLFWGSAGKERTTLIEQLRGRREESLDLLNYMAEWQRNGSAFVDEYNALVFSYMRMRLESELNWIAEVTTQLAGPEQLPIQDPQWLSIVQKARRKKALEL